MGWARGLVWFPSKQRWTQKNKKSAPYPKLVSRPQTQSSYKLVSWKIVCLEICLTCTCPTFPRKPRNLFSHQSPKLRQHPSSRGFLPSFLPKSFREETLVPGHGQDFNTLLCTAWNEPKIALWNDWSRRHFVKNFGSYKMIRPTNNVRKMPPEWNMGQAFS